MKTRLRCRCCTAPALCSRACSPGLSRAPGPCQGPGRWAASVWGSVPAGRTPAVAVGCRAGGGVHAAAWAAGKAIRPRHQRGRVRRSADCIASPPQAHAMALAQARVLTGARAMTLARPSTSKVSNGSRWFMKRKDSYMVEVRGGPAGRSHRRAFTASAAGARLMAGAFFGAYICCPRIRLGRWAACGGARGVEAAMPCNPLVARRRSRWARTRQRMLLSGTS